jgi:bacillithiol biosynthesis cysteine-adding enzyme BshC
LAVEKTRNTTLRRRPQPDRVKLDLPLQLNPPTATPQTGESPAHTGPVSVDVRRFPWVKRLAADYAFAFDGLAPFFSGNPADTSAWAAAIARTQSYPRRREELARAIAAQQQRRGAPAQAVAAGARLADAKSVAVITGQQAGLFGGPVYTLLKAITALKLAEKVSRDHGVPAVAVFWVEAEDHDWDEVRSCKVLDEELTCRTVSLPPRPPGNPVPVATIELDDQINAVLAELEHVLPATEFKASLLADLRAAYKPGAGMSHAFARWMEQVLGERGLIVYDASDPQTKPLVSHVFKRELSTPGHTSMAAAKAGADLSARGYHAQVQTQDGSPALFRLGDSRRPIRQESGQLVVDEATFAPAALAQEAAERPAGFSPGVLLRPVVQDALFPTLCYVAGPSELAYLGQLRGVYEHFGVPMPLIYPRATATLVDSAAARFLGKYSVPLEALQPQDDSGLNELLKSQIPPEVDETFAAARAVMENQMQRVVGALQALDPTLEGAARTTLGRMQHDLENLHGKTIQAAKRRHETLRRQFFRARALTFPEGHPQERTIGFIWFLNQYGSALIDRLWDALPIDMGQHWVITI